MMGSMTGFTTGTGQQQKLLELQKELHAKECQLKSVQRNYKAVSSILHERLRLLDDASKLITAEKSESEQLRLALKAAVSRADAAEQQWKDQVHFPQQMLQLQQEAEQLRATTKEDCKQRQVLLLQLTTLQQDLHRMSDSKQQVSTQLEEQRNLATAHNSAITKLRQQLEDENTECRALRDTVHQLTHSLSCSSTAQQGLKQQVTDLEARLKAAEAAAASELAHKSKLQHELTTAKGGQANNALRLLDLQGSHQLLEDSISRLEQALALEKAAGVDAAKQTMELQSQLAIVTKRAEAGEVAAGAAAIQLSRAEQALADAKAAQFAAEEACKAATAKTRLVTERLVGAQAQAERDKGVAEATHHELRECIADKESALLQLQQQQQSWRFRQLELMTRVLSHLDALADRCSTVQLTAGTIAATVEQHHDQQQGRMQKLLCKLEDWHGTADQLSGVSGCMNTSLVRLQHQLLAQHQKLRSSDKAGEMLQQQLEHLEQQLSMVAVMERKLRADLADEQAARGKEAAEAQQQVTQAATALEVAEQAAAAAQDLANTSATTIAQLHTKLATAESDLLSLRFRLGQVGAELSGSNDDIRAAGRVMQQLAMSATQMVELLINVLQPHTVAQLLSALSGLALRPSTSSRPQTAVSSAASAPRPRTAAGSSSDAAATAGTELAGNTVAPDDGVASAGSVAVDGGSTHALSTARLLDSGRSKQLLEGLACLQQQMQLMTTAVQQMSQQNKQLSLSLHESEHEVQSTAAKLLHTEESLASNYTCLICMKTFERPVSVVPCGHNYCKSCFISTGRCPECSSTAVDGASGVAAGGTGPPFVPAPALERLCAKHEYRMLALQGLQRLVAHRQQKEQLHGGQGS